VYVIKSVVLKTRYWQCYSM